jgi:hypothetical protein
MHLYSPRAFKRYQEHGLKDHFSWQGEGHCHQWHSLPFSWEGGGGAFSPCPHFLCPTIMEQGFVFQFCDIIEMMIIHKMI